MKILRERCSIPVNDCFIRESVNVTNPLEQERYTKYCSITQNGGKETDNQFYEV